MPGAHIKSPKCGERQIGSGHSKTARLLKPANSNCRQQISDIYRELEGDLAQFSSVQLPEDAVSKRAGLFVLIAMTLVVALEIFIFFQALHLWDSVYVDSGHGLYGF